MFLAQSENKHSHKYLQLLGRVLFLLLPFKKITFASCVHLYLFEATSDMLSLTNLARVAHFRSTHTLPTSQKLSCTFFPRMHDDHCFNVMGTPRCTASSSCRCHILPELRSMHEAMLDLLQSSHRPSYHLLSATQKSFSNNTARTLHITADDV